MTHNSGKKNRTDNLKVKTVADYETMTALAEGSVAIVFLVEEDETNDGEPTHYLYDPDQGIFWIPTQLEE